MDSEIVKIVEELVEKIVPENEKLKFSKPTTAGKQSQKDKLVEETLVQSDGSEQNVEKPEAVIGAGIAVVDEETAKLLETYQFEIEGLFEEEAKQVLKVGRQYSKLRSPYFEKRENILKKIPKFWSKVIQEHPYTKTMLTERERQYLQYLNGFVLEDIYPTDDSAVSGYKMQFFFNKNPFFENESITKECLSVDDETWKLEKADIKWKEHKAIATGKIKTVTTKNVLTFFSWLQTGGNYAEEDPTSQTLKNDLWFNPMSYYSQTQM